MQRQRISVACRLVFSVVVAIAVFSLRPTQAQERRADPSNGGGFASTLFRPVALVCEGDGLESVLNRFSQRYNFAYFIDRRVDPATPISGSFSDVPFVDALRQMLERAGLSFCCVDDSFLWVGPGDAAGELLLLFALKREENASQPPKIAGKMNSSLDFKIADFAEPRDVFQTLSQRLRVRFVGFEKTPFDRWRGVDFRAVVASDLTTTLLFGFGVDYRWDDAANALKPVALDRSREIERSYPNELVRTLDRKTFSGCRFSNESNAGTVEVAGTFADVARVEYAVALLANEKNRPSEPSRQEAATERGDRRAKPATGDDQRRKEVGGTVKNIQLRDLFAYLEKNLGTTFSLDASLVESGVTLDRRITCEFKDADRTKVAATIAAKLGATFRVDGKSVVFSKSKTKPTDR